MGAKAKPTRGAKLLRSGLISVLPSVPEPVVGVIYFYSTTPITRHNVVYFCSGAYTQRASSFFSSQTAMLTSLFEAALIARPW